jgi:hypothetical protein
MHGTAEGGDELGASGRAGRSGGAGRQGKRERGGWGGQGRRRERGGEDSRGVEGHVKPARVQLSGPLPSVHSAVAPPPPRVSRAQVLKIADFGLRCGPAARAHQGSPPGPTLPAAQRAAPCRPPNAAQPSPARPPSPPRAQQVAQAEQAQAQRARLHRQHARHLGAVGRQGRLRRGLHARLGRGRQGGAVVQADGRDGLVPLHGARGGAGRGGAGGWGLEWVPLTRCCAGAGKRPRVGGNQAAALPGREMTLTARATAFLATCPPSVAGLPSRALQQQGGRGEANKIMITRSNDNNDKQ